LCWQTVEQQFTPAPAIASKRYQANNNNMGLKYLEKVIVDTEDKEYQDINHKVGVNISDFDIDVDEEGYVLYFIDTDDYCWFVPSKYLKSTGKFEDEKNIYDGTVIHVVVDKDGEGKIAP
jgi:hypothetical protein